MVTCGPAQIDCPLPEDAKAPSHPFGSLHQREVHTLAIRCEQIDEIETGLRRHDPARAGTHTAGPPTRSEKGGASGGTMGFPR
jgi:hypothetical protein